MADAGLGPEGLSTELRPGVRRPDWSRVTSPAAQQTLRHRTVHDALVRWSGLNPEDDRAWQAVIGSFLEQGRAPTPAELALTLGRPQVDALRSLRALSERDLVLGEDGGAVVAAYPFSSHPTGHRVRLRGRELHALCAVDALGAGAMAKTESSIASTCGHCGAPITVETSGGGTTLGAVSPAKAVVWYAIRFDGCSARSSCPRTIFFCDDDHLGRWLAADRSRRNGDRLTVAEAFEVGVALFGPVLRVPKNKG